jgi:catechol 2,3-dioxygenase-like lactoylglutathione lyase family enzyme
MPYHESPDFEATRAFYTWVLGLEEGKFGGGYIGFGSGQAQLVFAPPGVEPGLPDMGVDVDSRGAVDAAHAEAVRAGHEVIYGPVDEPWGVRRFFVRDPHGDRRKALLTLGLGPLGFWLPAAALLPPSHADLANWGLMVGAAAALLVILSVLVGHDDAGTTSP